MSEELKASRMSLVDSEGRVRAVVDVAVGGTPTLTLLDDVGVAKARFALGDARFGRTAMSSGQHDGALASGLSGGMALAVVSFAAGAFAIGLLWSLSNRSSSIESSSFELTDRTGRVRAELALLDNGQPSLRLYDQNSVGRAWLMLSADGTPWLTLHDPDGNARVSVSAIRERPRVSLFDAEGKLMNVLGVPESPGGGGGAPASAEAPRN